MCIFFVEIFNLIKLIIIFIKHILNIVNNISVENELKRRFHFIL